MRDVSLALFIPDAVGETFHYERIASENVLLSEWPEWVDGWLVCFDLGQVGVLIKRKVKPTRALHILGPSNLGTALNYFAPQCLAQCALVQLALATAASR